MAKIIIIKNKETSQAIGEDVGSRGDNVYIVSNKNNNCPHYKSKWWRRLLGLK